MALQLGPLLMSLTDRLRFEPVGKRIRASVDGETVLETTDAALVWEPRRVVPMYAVPEADVSAALEPYHAPEPPPGLPGVLGPEHFEWHFHEGASVTLVAAGRSFEGAGFLPADPDLRGRVIVDWAPFDWREEDAPVTGHPHDPFKRIDVLRSDRHVVVSLDGQVLADSRRAIALYETHLPVRWYFPREDVRMDALTSTESTSVCAYKGEAAYLSAGPDAEGTDIGWTYRAPLAEVADIEGHVCFYAERSDLSVDGVSVPRPRTLWSSPRDQETR